MFKISAYVLLLALLAVAVQASWEDDKDEQQQQVSDSSADNKRTKRSGVYARKGGVGFAGQRIVSAGTGGYGAGYSAGAGYSGGPAISSLYSYAPRRANAALYGGIHGPQTNEEALKFDTHLTRSMIADIAASSGRQLYQGYAGIVPAAIQSRRNIQFYDVPSNREAAEPVVVEVGASPASQLQLRFKSVSSPIAVEQDHQGTPGLFRETSSEEEPHRLVHTVTRPIFQEVREVIQPFRKVTQEIQPVQEDIQTVVARGEDIVSGGGTVFVGGADEDADGGAIITSGGGAIGSGAQQFIGGGNVIGTGGSTGFIGTGGQSAIAKLSGQAGYRGTGYSAGAGLIRGGVGYGASHGGFRTKPIAGYGATGGAYASKPSAWGAGQVQIPFAKRAAAAGAARGARGARARAAA